MGMTERYRVFHYWRTQFVDAFYQHEHRESNDDETDHQTADEPPVFPGGQVCIGWGERSEPQPIRYMLNRYIRPAIHARRLCQQSDPGFQAGVRLHRPEGRGFKPEFVYDEAV